MFKIVSFLCLIFILTFFLCIFTSPIIFIELHQIMLAFLSDEVRFAIFLSIVTATCSTIASLIICLPIAYALSRYNFQGKSVIEGFLDTPMAVPPVALGIMLLIFSVRNPLGIFINEKVIKFVFEVPGIILAQFTVLSPLAIKMLKEVFNNISPRYEMIARTLGYTELESFLYITLPATKNSILGVALLLWARAIGEFGATMMLAGAMRLKTETMSIAIYLSLAAGDLVGVATLSLILLLISCGVQVIVRRLLQSGFVL